MINVFKKLRDKMSTSLDKKIQVSLIPEIPVSLLPEIQLSLIPELQVSLLPEIQVSLIPEDVGTSNRLAVPSSPPQVGGTYEGTQACAVSPSAVLRTSPTLLRAGSTVQY